MIPKSTKACRPGDVDHPPEVHVVSLVMVQSRFKPKTGSETTADCIVEPRSKLISNTAVAHKGGLFIFQAIYG